MSDNSDSFDASADQAASAAAPEKITCVTVGINASHFSQCGFETIELAHSTSQLWERVHELAPDVLVVKPPNIPTTYDRKGQTQLRQMVNAVCQQLATGRDVILVDNPKAQAWRTDSMQTLIHHKRLNSELIRWCSLDPDNQKLKPGNVTRVLSTINLPSRLSQ